MLRAFVEEPFDLVVGLAREQDVGRAFTCCVDPNAALTYRADYFAMVAYFYCLRHGDYSIRSMRSTVVVVLVVPPYSASETETRAAGS